jgi:hypothetical protein
MSFKKTLLLLFGVAVLAYGLLIPQLGFYWDEFPMAWIYFRLGPAALAQYFSTNRPFWGLIYQAVLPLLGPVPWHWQVYTLVLHWLSAVLVYGLLRQVWPQTRRPALWTSLLFLVFPGFGQQFIALMYGQFYVVLDCFLLSLILSLLAVRRRSMPLHLLALAFSFVNLLTMEYFYFLEFARLGLLWLVVEKPKIRRVTISFAPYLALWVGLTLWRVFFFKFQTTNYKYVALEQLQANPFSGILNLLTSIGLSFWESVPKNWLSAFTPIDFAALGLRTAILTLGLAFFISTLALGLILYRWRNLESDGESSNNWPKQALALGGFTWLVAGGSFWLVGILPKTEFNGDRFLLPFMLGSSLLLVGGIGLLAKWPRVQITLLALVLGLSISHQFQTANAYRRDWAMQKTLFWQMAWRMPALEPGTTVLSNDLPVTFYSDNSLTGPLNWIYGRQPGKMDYIFYFASVRTQPGRAIGQGLAPNLPITQDYLAATFHGNTSQMVVINFEPPACLRVLDPEIDGENRLLEPLLRDAAFLSTTVPIAAENLVTLPAQFYSPEIPRGWCYYFEKADLARQLGDWPQVVKLGEQALALGDHPNDPVENFVFIEGFAHAGQWAKAGQLTKTAYRFSKEIMRPLLCKLWGRIERETPASPEQAAAVAENLSAAGCGK